MTLTAIWPVSTGAACRPMIADLKDRVTEDLDTLGVPVRKGARPFAAAPDPLALDYVLTGSRLGSAILRKRWQSSNDPMVRLAARYCCAPSYIRLWKAVCQTAEQLDSAGSRSNRIVRDTIAIFDFYAACATDLTRHKEGENV